MDSTYVAALTGTLQSPPDDSGSTVVWDVTTDLPLPLTAYAVGSDGSWSPVPGAIQSALASRALSGPESPGQHGPTDGISGIVDSQYVVVRSALSGAFVCVLQAPPNLEEAGGAVEIGFEYLSEPNDIGPYPEPTNTAIIPTDSLRVLVGVGVAVNGNTVTREQFWRRGDDSYALAPGETRTLGYTVTSGMQQTTSQQDTIATSLGVSASAGWGPVSASVSASLSTNSVSFQQLVVSEETTRYETVTLTNPSDTDPTMFLKWQLVDVYTVHDQTWMPVSSLVMAQSPVLVGGPYNPTALPAATARQQAAMVRNPTLRRDT